MRLFSILSVCLLCIACAGTPPAWWNPSGKYTNTESASEHSASVKKITPVTYTQQEIPTEEEIEPSLENYEEMKLDPLSETEGDDSYPADEPEDTSAEDELPLPSVLQ